MSCSQLSACPKPHILLLKNHNYFNVKKKLLSASEKHLHLHPLSTFLCVVVYPMKKRQGSMIHTLNESERSGYQYQAMSCYNNEPFI